MAASYFEQLEELTVVAVLSSPQLHRPETLAKGTDNVALSVILHPMIGPFRSLHTPVYDYYSQQGNGRPASRPCSTLDTTGNLGGAEESEERKFPSIAGRSAENVAGSPPTISPHSSKLSNGPNARGGEASTDTPEIDLRTRSTNDNLSWKRAPRRRLRCACHPCTDVPNSTAFSSPMLASPTSGKIFLSGLVLWPPMRP